MNTAQLLAKRADHKTAHVLHLLLSLVTAGLWVPIWILVAVSHGIERRKIDRKISRINLPHAWEVEPVTNCRCATVKIAEPLRKDLFGGEGVQQEMERQVKSRLKT